MCRAKKEENNGAAPLRSVSGEVFATFASLLLVALVLMCMLQTGLSCAYFAQERKSALTAVLDGATAMAETYASEGNIVTLPGGDNELVERAKTGFELFNTSSDALVFVADRDGNILMHTGKDVAESAKIPQNLQEEMDSGKDIFLMGTMDDTLHDKYYIGRQRGLFVCCNTGTCAGGLYPLHPDDVLAVLGGHPDCLRHFVHGAGAAHYLADRTDQPGRQTAGRRRFHRTRPRNWLSGAGGFCHDL